MTEPTDDIIIISAGIAGMAVGCYAQMNGYKTRIFKLHHLPGGLCTAWQHIYGRTIYDHEQIQEADMLIDLLEEYYPGIKADI